MDTYGMLFLLCVAVFAVTCKPATSAVKGNREKLVKTLQDEINKLNKQVSQLKEVYKDAAEKSIEKAMADDKDSHVETATITKVESKDERHYHLPSVEDSLKEAFDDVKTIPEAPAIKAEDVQSKTPFPIQPTKVGENEVDETKAIPMDDNKGELDFADFTGTDFDEFLDGEKKDAAKTEKKSVPAADLPHQNGPTHDAVTKKDEKKDTPSDQPSAEELADFFGNKAETGKLSTEQMKEMLTDEVDSTAHLDESEEVKRKEIAKREFNNLSDQLREVRTDIVAIGKDFGGMRNDYLAKKVQPLSEDARNKLQELKDDFKEIISEFKEMSNELPKNADEMNDEEYDRADPSKPHYTNDEMEVLVNDMKNELAEVAKKMVVVKDAVLQHDKKAENADEKTRKEEQMAEALEAAKASLATSDSKTKSAEERAREEEKKAEALEAAKEQPKSDEEKAKMDGLQDELKDIMKEAKGLRAEVLEQRSKNEKRDQDTINKQMQEMRDLRDEVTSVRAEMKALQDEKKHA